MNRGLVSITSAGDLDRLPATDLAGERDGTETVRAGGADAKKVDGPSARAARRAGLIDSIFTRAHEGTTLPLSRDRECRPPAAAAPSSATASPVTTPPVALLTFSAARAAHSARGQQVGDNTGKGARTGTGGRRTAA